MKYVVSDLHGCFYKFLKMLELINFSKKDELYILGDIIDRGNNSLDIYEYIISHENIHMIKGNHEDMCIKALEDNELDLWMYNNGDCTLKALMNKGVEYTKEFLKYIKNLPYYKVVDNYLLVHAGVYTPNNVDNNLVEVLDNFDEYTALWDRSNINKFQEIKNFKIICGHTPVQSIISPNHNSITYLNGKIYIDCGAVFPNGKLACLCLEFYV